MQHQLTQTSGGFGCSTCLLIWKQKPRSDCRGLPVYYAWEEVPPDLHTETQFRKMHLKLQGNVRPAALKISGGNKYEWWLYRKEDTRPMREATPAQKAGRAKAWVTVQEQYRCPQCNRAPESLAEMKWFRKGGLLCENCAQWQAYEDEQRAIDEEIRFAHLENSRWSAHMLTRDDWVILDTETTDLYGYLCEIAVVNSRGRVLFHSLVNPRWFITPQARAVHGLSPHRLSFAPTLPEIWSNLWEAIGRRTLFLAYNAEFDRSTIERGARRYGLRMPAVQWECLMITYAGWYGEYSEYWHDFKWQPLPGGTHGAIGDALAALAVVKEMAAASPASEG
jgi:hypothetical protein